MVDEILKYSQYYSNGSMVYSMKNISYDNRLAALVSEAVQYSSKREKPIEFFLTKESGKKNLKPSNFYVFMTDHNWCSCSIVEQKVSK